MDEFSDLFSDVHCPLTAILKTKHTPYRQTNENSFVKNETVKLWDSHKADSFSDNIDIIKVAEIETKIDMMKENGNVVQEDINNIVNAISKVFNDTSRDTFGTYTQSKQYDKSNVTPWFDRSCYLIRNKYHRTRKAYNKYKTAHFKELLRSVSRQYKNTLRIAQRNYNMSKIEKLKKLKQNNPKAYWKIINSDNKKTKPSASLHDFYTFFKK